MNEDTNANPDAPQDEEQTEIEETQPQADTEVAAEETQEASESSQEEEIDIQDYWQERYPATQQGNNQLVSEVTQELSQLPTDESGTVEASAAAEWFARKLSEVGSRAEQSASRQAEKAAMAVVTETAQQQQLLKKYPEITKDKATLDAVFDLRDAAALRGQNLTLMQSAAKLDGLRKNARNEGAQGERRKTTVQAAAHLETASNRGGQRVEQVDLGDKNSRREMLKAFVQKEIEEGRIQHP